MKAGTEIFWLLNVKIQTTFRQRAVFHLKTIWWKFSGFISFFKAYFSFDKQGWSTANASVFVSRKAYRFFVYKQRTQGLCGDHSSFLEPVIFLSFSLWPGWTMEWVEPEHINYQAQELLFEYQSSGQMIAMGMTCNEKGVVVGEMEWIGWQQRQWGLKKENQYTQTMFVLIALSH